MKQTARRMLGDYEVHTAWEGFASIRQVSSGEIMHSRTPPMEEARRLYIEQSNLAQRLMSLGNEPLVIWDVGLGAAANAMAAIHCYEGNPCSEGRASARPMQIISFENDLDSLRLAVTHQNDFPYLEHDGPAAILKNGTWQSNRHPGLSWRLIEGDFVGSMAKAPPPDLIFYDMFSSKTSSGVWTLETFRKLFDACAGRATELFTYTCSTANRVGLLAAGFHVARGRNAGEKVETTIALTLEAVRSPFAAGREFLDSDWLGKWNRSRAKFPEGMPPDQRALFEAQIRNHPQFSLFSEGHASARPHS